jgi:hypothetical protein
MFMQDRGSEALRESICHALSLWNLDQVEDSAPHLASEEVKQGVNMATAVRVS